MALFKWFTTIGSAVLGVIHYWWKVKLDFTNPAIYAARESSAG